jgi:hypothetical protein
MLEFDPREFHLEFAPGVPDAMQEMMDRAFRDWIVLPQTQATLIKAWDERRRRLMKRLADGEAESNE